MSLRTGSSGSVIPPPLPGSARSSPPRIPTVVAPAVPAPAAVVAPVIAPGSAPIAVPVTAPVATAVAAPVTAPFAAPSIASASAAVLDEREHAIEVAAMLGDSVVAIKHCALPQEDRRLPARAWFVIAGVAGLIAGIAFALTLRVAARNDEGLRDWLKQGRPAHAFRPQLVGSGYDAAGFAGLGVALAAATLGLVRLRQARRHPLFRIGTAPEVELPVADAPMASFPVVSTRGGRLVVRAARALSGELVVDGVVTPVGELSAQGRVRELGDGSCELAMPVHGRLRLRCGSATLLLSVVPRPAQQLPGLGGQLDHRPFAYLAGALAVHLVAAALIRMVPEEATVASSDLITDELVSLRSANTALDDKPEEPEPGGAGSAAAGGDSSSAAMALPAGAAGDPKQAPAERRMAIKRTGDTEQLARQQAIAEAVRSGILGATALRERNFVAITGTADLTSGLAEVTAQGGFYGDEIGGAYGKFGGAPTGDGPGGGGDDGIIGHDGTYRTIGTIPGGGPFSSGSCRDARSCRHGLPGRSEFQPTLKTLGEPRCSGENGSCGIDKAIIRRYIKRATEKIRYCYEKELLAKPGLEGTVMSTFVISPSGTVLGSRASGVDDTVASCVAGVVGAIAFPRPGEALQVNFPFVFQLRQ